MSFNKNELILDRVRALSTYDLETDDMLFRLASLEDPSLNTTAEGEEVVDAVGSVIANLYRAKKGAFSATNSLLSLDLAAAQYGTKKEDIQDVLDRGHFAVMPLDMCGAIAMKRNFPTAIIYINKDKEELIRDIVESDYTTEEKTLRLLSIDAEKRNREICDYVIDNAKGDGGEQIMKLIFS